MTHDGKKQSTIEKKCENDREILHDDTEVLNLIKMIY